VGKGVGGWRGQEFNTKINCDSTPRQILSLNILLPAADWDTTDFPYGTLQPYFEIMPHIQEIQVSKLGWDNGKPECRTNILD